MDKNNQVLQDFMDKSNIRSSNETGLNANQRHEAYKIYNKWDLILSALSGLVFIFFVSYMYCAVEKIINQSVDTEILIAIFSLAIIFIGLPVLMLIIFKHTITKIKRKYHIQN